MAVAPNTTLNPLPQSPLEQLFWAHHQRILRAVYRITGNMADAEDVAQSVFLRVARSEDVQIEAAGSYLYRAAINGALDLLRNRQRGREVALESADEIACTAAESSPERRANSSELRRWLRSALSGLSPRAAEIFVLRYIEELDNGEISQLVGTSRAVVAVVLHQARTTLKKDFERQMRGRR